MTRPLVEPKKGKRSSKVSKHFLEPITSKVKQKRYVVYDIESKHEDTQRAGFTTPFLVGFYDPHASRYREYRDEPHLKARPWPRRHLDNGGCIDKLMVTFLSKKYVGAVAYAHNAGSFDALFLLTWLKEHRDDYEFEVVPVQSSIQMIRVWKAPEQPEDPIKERWEFLDSMKLLPMGLERACKAMGVPGKLNQDLEMHEDDPRWSAYLEQDCRALAAVMGRFYELVENRLGGEVGITTPSTAMRLFRRRHLGQDGVQEKIPRYLHFPGCADAPGKASGSRLQTSDQDPELKPEACSLSCSGCLHAWIRLGYYGGRTEIHHFYGERLHYFDFNSSYAASMTEDMPIGDLVVEEGVLDMRRHKSQGGKFGGFCECTVRIPPECPIPPLPHRDVKTGKLTFPAGQFHGVWSVDELALLSDPLVGGEIVHVVKTVWFGLRPMFQGMVKELWALRDKTREDYDEGLSLLGKLLVNGSYGKFAMRQERTTVVFARTPEEHGDARCFLCMADLPMDSEGRARQQICDGCEGSKPADPSAEGAVWYQKQTTDASYIVPQIAASITADARVRLWRTMRDVIMADAGEKMRAGKLTAGDVVLLRKVAHVVSRVREKEDKKLELTLRGPDEHGRSALSTVTIGRALQVRMAGRIYYLDTDSCITNVNLPSSDALGALKDEFDGEELSLLAIQAKCYLITRTGKNAQIAGRMDLVEGPVEDALIAPKVTLKGFPQRLRTAENLEKLQKGEVLAWDRLEKVRSLARLGFARSPQMQPVKKSFRSEYDKRLKAGNGTRSVVLDEPVGGITVKETWTAGAWSGAARRG